MMTDFEDQLRQRLQDHAEQIAPNPETWTKVQAGIRREQRFRWLYAGASVTALAALAAVAVLVVPGILSEPRIKLDPGPGVATQPEGATEGSTRTDGAFAPPLEMVLATPDGVVTAGPGGLAHVGVLPDTPAEAVAVRPGAVLDDLEVVASGGCQLRRFQRDPAGAAVHDIATVDPQACASGPRFSPDGGHLAWIEQAHEEGTSSLATVGWGPDGEERARNARFGLDLGALADAGVEGVELRVVEWVWVEDTGTAARGFLVLASRDAGTGTNRILTLEVERQADGALALPSGDRPALLEGGDARVVGYQRTVAATWTLEVTSIGSVRLVRGDEGERLATIDLPAGDPTWADLGPVWLEVAGETAVVGDGAGGAWTVTRDADGWSAVEPLAPAGSEDVAVLHGAVLGANDPTSPAEPFEPVRESEPGLEPAPSWPVEPPPDAVPAEPAPGEDEGAGLPAPVAERRAAILAAARAGDLDALAALADPDEFSYSFGEDGDPAGFWRARMAEGEDVLGTLIGVLGLPAAELQSEGGPAITAWPWVQDGTPYESLSSAELGALEEVVGPDVMEAYQVTGEYLGPRVGIRADGSWIYFTSGD